MFVIEREFQFDAAHRVLGHEGKCAHLHGHRYRVVFLLESDDLDKVGRVVDFGSLKERWGSQIDTVMDHGVILWTGDKLCQLLKIHDTGVKVAAIDYPATAEGIAKYLFHSFYGDVPVGVSLRGVRVYETPNCMGAYYDAGK